MSDKGGTMRKLLVAVMALALAFGFGASALADAECDGCSNVQDGDNDAEVTQKATANSGHAIGGQVVGVVSSGDTTINAKNRTEDTDVDTGDASASNSSDTFVGLSVSDGAASTSDAEAGGADNVQDGDNDLSLVQTASASSGDGVGGQSIGVTASGSAFVTLDNKTIDSDIDSGDGSTSNDNISKVGLVVSGFGV